MYGFRMGKYIRGPLGQTVSVKDGQTQVKDSCLSVWLQGWSVMGKGICRIRVGSWLGPLYGSWFGYKREISTYAQNSNTNGAHGLDIGKHNQSHMLTT